MRRFLIALLCLVLQSSAEPKLTMNIVGDVAEDVVGDVPYNNFIYSGAPVCGTDGKTYRNRFELMKAQRDNPNKFLEIAHKGPCRKHHVGLANSMMNLIQDIGCPKPVCGTNGRTFCSRDELMLAAKTTPFLAIAHEGKCKEYTVYNALAQMALWIESCNCPPTENRVCGTDGVTYANSCELDCIRFRDPELNLELDHKGPCEKESLDRFVKDGIISVEEDACLCTRNYDPICGTDGNTYGNKCTFNCEKVKNPELEVAFEGECENMDQKGIMSLIEKLVNDDCLCEMNYDPVCGTDGKTYHNLCLVRCAQCTDPELMVAFNSACDKIQNLEDIEENIVKEEDGCFCPAIYKPVCGSDGSSYSNVCELGCAQRNNKDLTVAHEGECRNRRSSGTEGGPQKSPAVASKSLRPCVCPENCYKPLCGTNGETYTNKCLFDCATLENEDLKIAYDGPCRKQRSIRDDEPSCPCPRSYFPLCASNGRTYNNLCLFDCAKTRHPELRRLFEGRCYGRDRENF